MEWRKKKETTRQGRKEIKGPRNKKRMGGGKEVSEKECGRYENRGNERRRKETKSERREEQREKEEELNTIYIYTRIYTYTRVCIYIYIYTRV
jgi:hypothetical protein